MLKLLLVLSLLFGHSFGARHQGKAVPPVVGHTDDGGFPPPPPR